MDKYYKRVETNDYRQYGQGILFSDGNALNEIATIIFNKCDGKTSLNAIIDYIYDEYECEKSELTKDVNDCINSMLENKLIFEL